MKIISIAAVTGGGRTTTVNELKKKLPKTAALYFDDYSFDGEVEDFHQWTLDGADYHVWDLKPLKQDIDAIKSSGEYEYLLLDYPFAYQHNTIKDYINCAIFIDTPLDIAMARRVLRDWRNSSAKAICDDMEIYLKYARIAYIQMLKDILPTSDYVVDGAQELDIIVNDILKIIQNI